MQLQAVLNKQDGTYLEMTGIISLSLNLIPVDHEGNTAYAIIGYPSPGAGYKLAMYNDEQKAHDEFDKLIEANANQPGAIYEIVSDFTQVVKAEETTEENTTVIGQGESAEIDGVEYSVSDEGELSITNLENNSVTIEGIAQDGEITVDAGTPVDETTEVVGGVELPVEETEAGGPVFG